MNPSIGGSSGGQCGRLVVVLVISPSTTRKTWVCESISRPTYAKRQVSEEAVVNNGAIGPFANHSLQRGFSQMTKVSPKLAPERPIRMRVLLPHPCVPRTKRTISRLD